MNPGPLESSVHSALEQPGSVGTAIQSAWLQRLATALSGYHDLNVTVRADDPEPCLAVRNTAVPAMSETVTVSGFGDGLAYRYPRTG